MPDVIKVLPDALANQIAAGEVIQRPASVVKELVENSVDAGASQITVNIKDAGRTLIQIIDNGIGMSETDARLAFERHSTSKISSTEDLFAIYTKGFRGEALASIVAVAQVELKTRRNDDFIGTLVEIHGSQLIQQQQVQCDVGCNFSVKNLFFNVPARRKFLKNNTIEFNHIVTEFLRVALAHPEIGFQLYHNNNLIYNLVADKLFMRISAVFGKQVQPMLTQIQIDTQIVKISGFIGKPEMSRKKTGNQFFFVNRRFMKNGYFHKAIMLAYEKLLPTESIPSYFIYFDIDPARIDVNIHPTKTEINFEDAASVFQLLQSGVKDTLNKYGVVPAIDFDNESAFEIPYFDKNKSVIEPEINLNPNYNPFKTDNSTDKNQFQPFIDNSTNQSYQNWELLYQNIKNNDIEKFDSTINTTTQQTSLGTNTAMPALKHFQLKNKYIVSAVKSGIMLIDQRRAHEVILFDKYMQMLEVNADATQQLLYPEKLVFDKADYMILYDLQEELTSVGFILEFLPDNVIIVIGVPPVFTDENLSELLTTITEQYKTETSTLDKSIKQLIAIILLKKEHLKGMLNFKNSLQFL